MIGLTEERKNYERDRRAYVRVSQRANNLVQKWKEGPYIEAQEVLPPDQQEKAAKMGRIGCWELRKHLFSLLLFLFSPREIGGRGLTVGEKRRYWGFAEIVGGRAW